VIEHYTDAQTGSHARKNVQAGINERDLPSFRAIEKISWHWFGISVTSFHHLLWLGLKRAIACLAE
jgi:hypothetical protein